MPKNNDSSLVTSWMMEDQFAIQEIRWAVERIVLQEDYYHNSPNPEDIALVETEADRLLTLGWDFKKISSALELIKSDTKRRVARDAHMYFDPPEE